MQNANILILLYWFFCYTIFLSLFVISGIRALQKIEVEKYHFLMILSFALLMIGSTLYTIFEISGKITDIVLQMITMAGVCLGIYAIPSFAFSLSVKTETNQIIARILKYIAIVFWLINLMNYLTIKNLIIFSFIYIFYFLIITITSTIGLLALKKIKDKKDDFYGSYISKIGVLSIFFVPLFIAVDLFSGFGLNFISILIQNRFRIYPLFFLIWSIIYLVFLFKYDKKRFVLSHINISDKNSIDFSLEKLNKFLLSPREIEVLKLLLEGLSYKQIASKLSISLATVKTHICRIYEKTGANSKIELINKLLK